VARHGNTLLYASERSGSLQAWRMDFRSGQSHRLTEADALDRISLTLVPDQRSFCFVDGRNVIIHPLEGGRARVVYRVPDTHEAEGGFSISPDGSYCTLAEKAGDSRRLRLIRLAGNTAQTLFEGNARIEAVTPRPDARQLLYRSSGALWLAPLDGGAGTKLAAGDSGPAYWARGGASILYLSLGGAQPNAIRQLNPDTGRDDLVSPTTRFVAFAPNIDDSVFIGASGSAVSPYLFISLRSVHRELTLCEHHAHNPSQCDPVFSPDSQHVFFVSDGEGKPAIYAMNLERLLEKTED
jgi:oligogalacturonide lyase